MDKFDKSAENDGKGDDDAEPESSQKP